MRARHKFGSGDLDIFGLVESSEDPDKFGPVGSAIRPNRFGSVRSERWGGLGYNDRFDKFEAPDRSFGAQDRVNNRSDRSFGQNDKGFESGPIAKGPHSPLGQNVSSITGSGPGFGMGSGQGSLDP